MRVLMIVPQYPFPVVGGLERQSQLLSAELAQTGVEVHVLSGKVFRGQPSVSIEQGVNVHRLPWPKSRLLRWLVLWPLAVVRMLQRIRQSDVVHAHVFSGFGLLAIMLGHLRGKPVLVKLPNIRQAGLPGMTSSRLGGLKVSIFKRADAVVAMATESLMELSAVGYDDRRILVTPNGVTLPTLVDRGKLGSKATGCHIVFIGRLHPAKGLSTLLDALVVLRCGGSNRIQLDIYGEGEQKEELAQRIAKAGLSGVVNLLGHCDQVTDVLQKYDALVLPSWREGNSNVILEAMAAGLPVISTRVGGTPMLVGPEGAAWLHEPGDVPGLATLLQRVVDPAIRSHLGRAMRLRAEKHFDIKVIAQTYAAAYRKLIEGRYEDIGKLSNPVIFEC